MNQPAHEAPVAAPVWRRLAAMVYDGMLLFAALFGATLALALISGDAASQPPGDDGVLYDIAPSLGGPLFQLYLAAVIVLFFSLFWRKNGQTLGMQAWRLRVQDANGHPPGWGRCLLRVLAAVPSLLLLGLGYWWIWLDPQQRAWHDRLSGTYVVVLPKPAKQSK